MKARTVVLYVHRPRICKKARKLRRFCKVRIIPVWHTIDKQIRIGFFKRKSENRLWRRLRIFKRRRTPPYPYRIQTTVLIVKKRRESAYSYFHYTKNMGRGVGKQRRFPARIYGDFAQKNRTVRRFAAIYSNSRRHRVQNDKD